MNSAKQVDLLVEEWKKSGLTKTAIIARTAEAEIGWSYVWGATGQECSPSKRKASIGRCSPDEAAVATKKCQVLNGKKSTCDGCMYYPKGERTLMDDCQGFVKQVCRRVGISFTGGGCTSMWNTSSNWSAKGAIDSLPEQLCCVFWTDRKDPRKKSHIGFYIGSGWMIHCSGKVKKEKLSSRCTNWAIPKGLEGGDLPVWRSTIRKGSKGDDVTYCQERLKELGFDPGTIDGKFGSKTKAAVQAFQRANGLDDDGVVGPLTWEKLEEDAPDGSLYTVTVPHLPFYQAEALKKQYIGSTMVKEDET